MLPNTRHACRVPPHLGVDDVVRIQRAAYKLPQVVTPADYAADDHHLDALGLILLQKGAASARPSRWIAPALMDEALRHLDAVGNDPEVRAAMAERSAVLDQLGVSRRGHGWERLVSRPLQLSPGWRVPLAFRAPIDATAVWSFYRTGDKAQMIFDVDRGWAWTQAIVGVPANEIIIIICSAYAVAAIENLLRLCGENCTVQLFERKQHVEPLPHAVPIAGLKMGRHHEVVERRKALRDMHPFLYAAYMRTR